MPPKRWIIFAAVSSEAQASEDKDSIPSQLRDAHAYIVSQGGIVIDEMIIPGFSRDYYTWREFAEAALDSKRKIDAPMRMIAHWKARDFDGLWIREPSRIGRKMGLVNEVIGRTVDAGAVVYVAMTDQTLTKQDSTIQSMIGGYTAEMELKTFKERRKMGMGKRISRGLPASRVPATHRVIRDPLTGDPIGAMVVRAEARAFFTRAAQLLLGDPGRGIAGLSYEAVEQALIKEGCSLPGVNLQRRRLVYRMLFSPSFWGHSAQNFRDPDKPNGYHYGFWMLDDGDPVPEGVTMTYNTHEPVLLEPLASELKAEMRRRSAFEGRASATTASAFTSLLVCRECGRTMGIGYRAKTKRGSDRYRCFNHYAIRHRKTCSQSAMIAARDVCAWIDEMLIAPLLVGNYTRVLPPDSQSQQADALRAALAETEERLMTLIDAQSRAPAVTVLYYSRQIEGVAKQIEDYKRSLSQLESHRARDRRYEKQIESAIIAYRAILPDGLWALPPQEINQFLFQILGPWQIAVLEGEAVGLQRRVHSRQKRA